MKKNVDDLREQVKVDDLAAEMHLMSFQKNPLNNKGYPYWMGHAAQELLDLEIAKGIHKTEPHPKLFETPEEQKLLPVEVFQTRVVCKRGL